MDEKNEVATPKTQGGPIDGLQSLREWMAMLISLVILVLSATTMWYTFVTAGRMNDVPTADSVAAERINKAQVDAYNRQKDIMLYALALFGTVTGYYLGRVPAEANAKRAEQAADTAQKQLTRTQDRLSDASASASVASAQVGRVSEDKAKVTASLRASTTALREVRATLSAAMVEGTTDGRATLSGGDVSRQDDVLRQAQDRIDAALAQIESQILS